MYGRQSGKDLHSIQSGPPKTESNEIDLFPFSSFSSIWFQVNKEGGKGKASIALTHTHTRTHTSIASAYFSPPFFSLAHFLGFSDSLAFFAHLNCWQKDFHSAFLPLSISPCHSTFVSFVSGISALSLAKA